MHKILLVIDHFGSGGAQRQIIALASSLIKNGYQVEFFIYYPSIIFFQHDIDSLNIKVHSVQKRTKGFSLRVVSQLRSLLTSNKYNSVISFLDIPSIYTELASLGLRNLKIIVSERNSYFLEKSKVWALVRRIMHLFADVVVANSITQTRWLCKQYPWLSKRTFTIYNGYNPNLFVPTPNLKTSKENIKIIGIGRIARQKNQLNLIRALILFTHRFGWCPTINWVGSLNSSAEPEYKILVLSLLCDFPKVNEKWNWLGECSNVPELISSHHALILPSLFEGLPNVVCEAFFCERPVLASNVCDHAFLVKEESRGFLFDPYSVESICDAMERFSELSEESMQEMGLRSRQFALENLTVDRMFSGYSSLLNNDR